MKRLILNLTLLLLSQTFTFSQIIGCELEAAKSFYPEDIQINQENIEWKFLSVPENWDKPSAKKIKLAIAIIKNTSNTIDSSPVLFIEGGPGAGAINGIWRWLNHPLRAKNDIVLVDVRGTGNSSPKFCPDLGKEFLQILSKNQNSNQDELQKTIAAMSCRQDLINRDIDISAYNSKSIAKDLHAIKSIFKYSNWDIYGVSYGTYIAQVYANDFPQDIKSIILDSSIADISQYYNSNTKNYVSSLNKIFDACKSDPECNQQFPNLENVYFETIEKLEKNPITVDVDKKVISSGKFTYNAEDFKIAIQQALYNKLMIQVIPMLINQFNKGDKNTLSSLILSFAESLGLDYGQYYCVTCNEVIPKNSLATFNHEAQDFKNLKGGLSFYKSDFLVCDKWNVNNESVKGQDFNLDNLSQITSPVLVFGGAFDPITPLANGELTFAKFKNAYLVNAPSAGHAPSFTTYGSKIVDDFLSNQYKAPNTKDISSENKVNFVLDVQTNKGVSKFGNSLSEFNFLFFAPLFIAFAILLFAIFNYCYLLIKNSKANAHSRILMVFIVLASTLALFITANLVMALNVSAQRNFYMLAFGLPYKYSYLFSLQWIFIIITLLTVLYFLFKIKTMTDATTMATILFSLTLIGVYFQYWGFLL